MKTPETFEDKEETEDKEQKCLIPRYLIDEINEHEEKIAWLTRSVAALIILAFAFLICISILGIILAVKL